MAKSAKSCERPLKEEPSLRARIVQQNLRRNLKEWQRELDTEGLRLFDRDYSIRREEEAIGDAVGSRRGALTAASEKGTIASLIARPELRERHRQNLADRQEWFRQSADHLLRIQVYMHLLESWAVEADPSAVG